MPLIKLESPYSVATTRDFFQVYLLYFKLKFSSIRVNISNTLTTQTLIPSNKVYSDIFPKKKKTSLYNYDLTFSV